jgi:glycosyltransferase involved in cell wall biosynthesis|tara:strand:+ start:1 stop:1029 length:1029 start_codon:yes stop_codon:yes gene_type:complete
MSVYNGEKYLRESIESILKQTFIDFVFLIINDGSTDASREIILSYNDPRIRLIENDENIGLASSLNKGLDIAEGKYIARMDADDISMPNRLEEQVNFMNGNPEVGVCGTTAHFIDSKGKVLHLGYNGKVMCRDEDMKAQLLFRPCFLHPTVIYRSKLLRGNGIIYEVVHGRYSQDYHLWYRLSTLCEFANISSVLFQYRVHDKQVNKSKKNDQFSSANNIRRIVLEEFLGRKIVESEKVKHTRISVAQHSSSLSEIDEAEDWLKFLINQNDMNRKYKRESLAIILQNIWSLLCMNSSHLGMRVLLRYFFSIFWKFKVENLYHELKLIFKCLIKYKVQLLAYD